MGNAKENFRQALCAVIAAYGIDILDDSRRTNALLMDYAPNQAKERKLIISALREGIGNELLKVRGESSNELQLCFNHCIRYLVDETWITEEAARFAVDVIAHAIGISDTESLQAKINSSPSTNIQEPELAKGTFDLNRTDLSTLLTQYQAIGYKAFAAEQSLKELVLPQNIKVIKSKAFLDCIHLRQIVLPATIEAIGAEAFSGCDALEEISLDRNNNYAIIDGMLIDQKEKALMRATRSAASKCVIPCEVTTVHAKAFERSEVRTIILPRNLSALSNKAFVLCERYRRRIFV